MESLIFYYQKGDSAIKVQTVANSSIQRSHMLKEEDSSAVVATKSLLLSGVINVKENCDVMTLSTFAQRDMPESINSE